MTAGIAHYAVYPEAYAKAARTLRIKGRPCVIGIRSIGTSLGAIVAVALGVPTFFTLRPFGDPAPRSAGPADRGRCGGSGARPQLQRRAAMASSQSELGNAQIFIGGER